MASLQRQARELQLQRAPTARLRLRQAPQLALSVGFCIAARHMRARQPGTRRHLSRPGSSQTGSHGGSYRLTRASTDISNAPRPLISVRIVRTRACGRAPRMGRLAFTDKRKQVEPNFPVYVKDSFFFSRSLCEHRGRQPSAQAPSQLRRHGPSHVHAHLASKDMFAYGKRSHAHSKQINTSSLRQPQQPARG